MKKIYLRLIDDGLVFQLWGPRDLFDGHIDQRLHEDYQSLGLIADHLFSFTQGCFSSPWIRPEREASIESTSWML